MLKYLLRLTAVAAVLFLAVQLGGCENDINKIKAIADGEQHQIVQRTTGVDVIYSDSARVKAHMLAPLMMQYPNKGKPYTIMPKGVKVLFYDDSLHQSNSVVADSGVQLETEKIIKLYHHVVATNNKGETFKSEELIWDQNTKLFHSDKQVEIHTSDGTVMNGTKFHSNQSFWPWTLEHTTGIIQVDAKDMEPLKTQ